MPKLQKFLALLLSMSVMNSLWADEITERLKALLNERFPATSVESVHASTDMPGYYEVMTATEIVYVDAKGERLLVGHVMDTATRENLTEKRWNDLNRIDFGSLPFEKAIKIVKGNGSRSLAIFEDPFCPYCKEFEKTLQDVTDVTIYVFLFPLESIHPGAIEAANDIWCAPNRVKAWTDWMSHDIQAEKTSCAGSPVEALVELGEQLNIFATPTLIFSDGKRVPGLISAERFAQHLEASR